MYFLAHSVFRNPEDLDECDIDAETKEVLINNIKRRMTPQAVKIRTGNMKSHVFLYVSLVVALLLNA